MTCECCNAPCEAITCNPCEAGRLRELLSSKAWMEVRGTSCGDLPGETLADTLRRELKGLGE
jgi:hypothetical protein